MIVNHPLSFFFSGNFRNAARTGEGAGVLLMTIQKISLNINIMNPTRNIER